MKNSIYVFCGGMLGGFARHLVGILESENLGTGQYSTLTVNLLGAMILSFISFYSLEKKSIDIKSGPYLGLTTGMIGAFTSFSGLCKDIFIFAQEDTMKCIIYVLISTVGGYMVAYLGMVLGRQLAKY